jgi:hypothetical protein
LIDVAAASAEQCAHGVQQNRIVNALGVGDSRLGDVFEDQHPMLAADVLAAQGG